MGKWLGRSNHTADGQGIWLNSEFAGYGNRQAGRIIIETSPKKVTLEELLAKFDPVRHGGESMAYAPVGKELL